MRHTDRDPFPNTPRNIRLDAGLKTRQVAELMGCSVQEVNAIERARKNPTAARLARFYAACGREDLASCLMHVINDGHQDRVLDTYREWERRFGPLTVHGRALRASGAVRPPMYAGPAASEPTGPAAPTTRVTGF
jgi:transcriptional regulator with XRE-family HTH domain